MMNDILSQILSELPKDKISDIRFEAAKIVIYVKDKELFIKGFEIGKELAQKFKKRFEIRMDPKLLPPEEDVIERIKALLPDSVGLKNIYIEKHLSVAVIEALHPEKIDKQLINIIRNTTLYSIKVQRAPLKTSKIIDTIRAYLHKNSEYRAKFLHQVGKRIISRIRPSSRIDIARLSILGGGREVGRSALFLRTSESRILVDFGVGVSNIGEDSYPLLNIPDFDINELDAVIISHAHLDHIGFVPFLFKAGWRGPVYLTAPTRDLGALVLFDYYKVALKQLKQPPFSPKEIKDFLKHTITLEYGEVTDITPDLKITFHNAGHILGSAMVHINIDNKHNILYTGDLKVFPGRLHNPPHTRFPRLETLIIETTYGGIHDYHPPKEETEKEFIKDIKETIEKRGKVLIPVLAVGRAQEIMLLLEEYIERKELPPVNIYIDGIVWETSMIYTAYPEFLSKEAGDKIARGENIFEKEYIIRASPKERKQIMEEQEPVIIISTSGMMNGGPILDYFKYGAEDSKNLLALVSYQAKGTIGRALLEGIKEIKIGDELVKVNLKIKKYDGFSGHADRKELLYFIRKLTPKPKEILAVHGEPPKPYEFIYTVYRKFNIIGYYPAVGDSLLIKR